MKTKVEIKINDITGELEYSSVQALAKLFVKENVPVEDMVSIIKETGYQDFDILCCLNYDEVRSYVIGNEF